MTGKKRHSNQQWPSKTVMRQIWRVIFKGRVPFLGWRNDPLKQFCWVKTIACTDKVNVINNSAEFIWIFAVDNSINANLTWLKNSTQNVQKYMQIWRVPMSPLQARTNSPGHVTTYFRTSMSETSPPQGPNMWYLTFYQNKVLIYQAIVTNSLSFKISP